MENIDWDKAPEGTEYWCDDQWFKVIDGEWFAWYPLAISWAKPAYKSPENFSWWGRAVERPSPSPAWSGEGLPPVGVVCEFKAGHGNFPELSWSEVRIVSHDTQGGSDFAVFASISGYGGCRDHSRFRPIRTAEQIAADEREAAILQMLKDAGRPDTAKTRDQAQLLYDAGWRKP